MRFSQGGGGGYFSALWIYRNGKLDTKSSDRIYGDDLHLSGEKMSYKVAMFNELPYMAFTTYALPSNKNSQRLEFADAEYPLLSYLSYRVMEFQWKTYVVLYNRRFFMITILCIQQRAFIS